MVETVKKNVGQFDDDVRTTGSYLYTAQRVSSQLANARISQSIRAGYDFAGKRVLDVGCGDGAYTVEFAAMGVREVLGLDPAEVAVSAATARAQKMGCDKVIHFKTGNIYALEATLGKQTFDVAVIRGVLHHLPDPEAAVARVAAYADTVIILEPNGYNPVLKLLEKFSRYHVEHEERSFLAGTLKSWATRAGLRITRVDHINLVPMFCPDWMARVCKFFEPWVERIPVLRQIVCGQCLIVASRK